FLFCSPRPALVFRVSRVTLCGPSSKAPLPMLAALRRFVTEFSAAGRDAAVGPDEIQLAAASLLFHTVAVDGAVAESERMLLADLLARHFELGKADADELVEAARQAEAEAI